MAFAHLNPVKAIDIALEPPASTVVEPTEGLRRLQDELAVAPYTHAWRGDAAPA